MRGAAAGIAPFRARLHGWRWFGEVMLPERICAQWTDRSGDGTDTAGRPAIEADLSNPANDDFFTFLDAKIISATAL
jgi:hypothetical protein